MTQRNIKITRNFLAEEQIKKYAVRVPKIVRETYISFIA